MEILMMERREGKTRKLIEVSAITGLSIVTLSERVKHVQSMAREMSATIPPVIGVNHVDKLQGTMGIRGMLIDDLDEVLERLFQCPIYTATMTKNKNKISGGNYE